MVNNLYEQVSNQLYINGSCKINQWKDIILNNDNIEIKVQAMMNNKGFIHIRKIEKIKDAIKLQLFHFGQHKELKDDGFGYAFKGSGI